MIFSNQSLLWSLECQARWSSIEFTGNCHECSLSFSLSLCVHEDLFCARYPPPRDSDPGRRTCRHLPSVTRSKCYRITMQENLTWPREVPFGCSDVTSATWDLIWNVYMRMYYTLYFSTLVVTWPIKFALRFVSLD